MQILFSIVSMQVLLLQSPETGSNKVYSEEEVAEHASKDVGVWVTYKGGVYDVTDWVSDFHDPRHGCDMSSA